MKLSKKIFSLSCVLLFIFLSTASCEKKITKAECPFTTITWENSLADIKKLEGEPAETDDSGYDGLAYIYQSSKARSLLLPKHNLALPNHTACRRFMPPALQVTSLALSFFFHPDFVCYHAPAGACR